MRTVTGTELPRVRTELQRRRIFTSIPPHPVQPNRQPALHRSLGDAPVPMHRQVEVATPPVRVAPCRRLGRLHQQESQQRIALLADVPQSLLAAWKTFPSSHDQQEGQGCQRTHARMRHPSLRCGSLPSFPLHSRGLLCAERRWSMTPELQDNDRDRLRAPKPPSPARCIARPPWIQERSFRHERLQDRGPRDRQTQCDMPCLRRIPSNTSLVGRVRPWATSSSPWRIPSSESVRAAMSSRRW
jgi:hypothetical protein